MLVVYYEPGTALGTKDIVVNKIDKQEKNLRKQLN